MYEVWEAYNQHVDSPATPFAQMCVIGHSDGLPLSTLPSPFFLLRLAGWLTDWLDGWGVASGINVQLWLMDNADLSVAWLNRGTVTVWCVWWWDTGQLWSPAAGTRADEFFSLQLISSARTAHCDILCGVVMSAVHFGIQPGIHDYII